ncbi:MAG: hypothetical protein GXO66_07620 [Euryarchaeota archaeon]|nr:hypothetical protein [Euryarchaeota archaeon]
MRTTVLPGREVMLWVVAYSLAFLVYGGLSYLLVKYPPPGMVYSALFLLVSSSGMVFPSPHPLQLYISFLGVAASLVTLGVASARLGLRGLRLFGLAMLPPPAIAGAYGALRALLSGATDTPWWGWALMAITAYLLLLAASLAILKLEGEV